MKFRMTVDCVCISVMGLLLVACNQGKVNKPNDVLLKYIDEEKGNVCLDYIMSFKGCISKFEESELEYVWVASDLFETDEITAFEHMITSESWTGYSYEQGKKLEGEEKEKYKESLGVWVEFDEPIYYLSIACVQGYEEGESKQDWCAKVDAKLDDLINKYYR